MSIQVPRILTFLLYMFSQGVIQKIAEIHKLRCVSSLGLRLTHLHSDALHWLHPDLGVSHVREKYEKQHPQEEWRLPKLLCFTN